MAANGKFSAHEMRSYGQQLNENPLFQAWIAEDKQGAVNQFISSADESAWREARAVIHRALNWENRLKEALAASDASIEEQANG